MIVAKQFTFDSSHMLPGYAGNCSRQHGHSYVLEVAVEGEINEETGMVIDFNKLKAVVGVFIGSLDHHDLNDIYDMPTAENLAYEICKQLKRDWEDYRCEGELLYVKVFENPFFSCQAWAQIYAEEV